MLRQKLSVFLISLCAVLLFAAAAHAQEISFNYYYQFDNIANADTPPQINGFNFDYPDSARKKGVEGTLKASMMLGADGKVSDIKILQTLPYGVEETVIKGLQNFYYKPATKNGKPVPVKMTLDFIVTAIYDESDKNVNKPQILEKPAPVYPAKYIAEKLKGKVQVLILFFTDGKMKIVGINSVLPREFDKAATEAAEKIRFQPAVHKKSKSNVAQKMTVEYEFKP